MTPYTEDHLVEQPAIQLMQHELGWDVVNCYGEWALLRPAQRDYEGQDGGAIEGAVEEICRDRTALFWRRRTGGLTSNNANF